jgi:hypothetical protein
MRNGLGKLQAIAGQDLCMQENAAVFSQSFPLGHFYSDRGHRGCVISRNFNPGGYLWYPYFNTFLGCTHPIRVKRLFFSGFSEYLADPPRNMPHIFQVMWADWDMSPDTQCWV